MESLLVQLLSDSSIHRHYSPIYPITRLSIRQ